MNNLCIKFWTCLTTVETCRTEYDDMDKNQIARTFLLTAIAPKTTKVNLLSIPTFLFEAGQLRSDPSPSETSKNRSKTVWHSRNSPETELTPKPSDPRIHPEPTYRSTRKSPVNSDVPVQGGQLLGGPSPNVRMRNKKQNAMA
jgi:hypothetical protein